MGKEDSRGTEDSQGQSRGWRSVAFGGIWGFLCRVKGLEGWPDSSRGRGAQGPQGTYALDQNVIQEAVQ